jgi:arabinofuranosyltransferase
MSRNRQRHSRSSRPTPEQPVPPPSLDDQLRLTIRGRAVNLPDLAIVAAALIWLVVVLVATHHRELIASDDAFISFQYARNLAHGHGLVFNLGERVWGFTSPLQTLLLAIVSAVGVDTIRAGLVAGFLWTAVSAVLLHFLISKFLPRTFGFCLGLYFLLDPSQHGPYAMESGLLVALQLGFLIAVTGGKSRLANILAALSCLTRPDSLLLVLPIMIADRETRRLKNLAWFAGIGLVWETFAYAYYGTLLPNSLDAKIGLSQFGEFFATAFDNAAGLTFAKQLGFPARSSTVVRGLVAVLALCPLLSAQVRRRFLPAYCLLIYPWVLISAYAYIGSFRFHSWEFYSARFFLRVAAAFGLLTLAEVTATRLRLRQAWRWATFGLVAAFTIGNGLARSPEFFADLTTANHSYWNGARNTTYRQIADWVTRNLPKGDTIAISEVGTFAYYTEMKVIDVSGIITRGYHPDERMNHAAFLLRFTPRYAILYGDHPDVQLSPSLRYRRLMYFPKQGFEDFSLMAVDGS